jgi:hypothetical protein
MVHVYGVEEAVGFRLADRLLKGDAGEHILIAVVDGLKGFPEGSEGQKDELRGRLVAREVPSVLDVQEAIDMARYMAGEGRSMFGHTAPSELPDKFCMSLRNPIGVVAVITPWNFPIAVPSWKILPAFVLGNTVVWKPSSDTRGRCRLLPLPCAKTTTPFALGGIASAPFSVTAPQGIPTSTGVESDSFLSDE